MRTALYQAAHVMLTKPVKGCSALKSWAMRLAKRAGMSKAKVALARKLAVIMHRMLADGKPFNPTAGAATLSLRGEIDRFSGGPRHQAFPKRSPFAGTMDQVRPPSGMWHHDHAIRRLADLILYRTPSGGGLAPTPYRSKFPASG